MPGYFQLLLFLLLAMFLPACQGSGSLSPGDDTVPGITAVESTSGDSVVSTLVPAVSWPQRAQNMENTGLQQLYTGGGMGTSLTILSALTSSANDQPVVDTSGNAYLTATGGEVTKINPLTRTVEWTYTVPGTAKIDAAAAISLDETLVFFITSIVDRTGDTLVMLECLDAYNGNLMWDVQIMNCNRLTDCAPIVDDNGDVVVTSVRETPLGIWSSVVAKYDAATGSLLLNSAWIPSGWITTPAVNGNGEVYVAVNDRTGGTTASEILRFDDNGAGYVLADYSVTLAGEIGPNCTPILYEAGGIDHVAVPLQDGAVYSFNQDSIYMDPVNNWVHYIPGAADAEFSNLVFADDGNLYLTERSVTQGVSRLVGLEGAFGAEMWESFIVDTTDCIAPCITMDGFIYVILGDSLSTRNLMYFDVSLMGDPGVLMDYVTTHQKSSPVLATYNGGAAVFYSDITDSLNIKY